MNPSKKLRIGAFLALLGGAGIIFGPLLGFTELVKPWSFILGFIFGVMTGIGVVITLFGLYEKRR
jgi:hypothetical protein